MTDPFDILRDELVAAAVRVQAPKGHPARRGHARARWPRWSRRRSHPLAAVLAALVLAGSATAAVVSITSRSSAPLSGRVPGPSTRPSRGFFNLEPGDSYRITVAPTLQAGTAGLCTAIVYGAARGRPGWGWGEGGCGRGYPTRSEPLFGDAAWTAYPHGRIPMGGAIEYILTGPEVAAVRVGANMIVRARSQPGLPAGDRAVVFYLPAGSPVVLRPWLAQAAVRQQVPAGVQPLTLTPLGRSGLPLATAPPGPPFHLPARFWQRPQRQPVGSCTIAAPARLRAVRGTVAYDVKAVAGVQGAALLSCVSTDYELDGTTITAAVMLNAADPASPPPAIFGTKALPGAPGVVSREDFPALAGQAIAARRDGNAWLVVEGGSGLAERLAVLRELRVARIELSRKQG
jgi:hypothetical protein